MQKRRPTAPVVRRTEQSAARPAGRATRPPASPPP